MISINVRSLIYTIAALLAIVLGGGCLFIAIMFFGLIWPDTRADIVASQAQAWLEPIYEQVRSIAPPEAVLVDEEEPRAGVYKCGLSAGTTRYAYVGAHQIYTTSADYTDVVESFNESFTNWDWVKVTLNPATPGAEPINSVFQHPDDPKLLIGLCQTGESGVTTGATQYTIFFDFNEGRGCLESCRDRLCSLATNYCSSR